MSILIFILVLFTLVLVHEWGHFIVAKKTGMRVDEFGIGFPPKLFGIKRGETEYTINSLPIGGFVRIFGENLNENIDDKDTADASRAFSARPKWAQALVLIAGVTMNVLFAWFLFSATFVLGVPTAVEESEATPTAKLYAAAVVPGSPIDGVIPVGAEITSVSRDGFTIVRPTPSAFSTFVTENAPAPVSVTFVHQREEKKVDIVPIQGLVESEPDRYLVGISLSYIERIRQPLIPAITDGFLTTIRGLESIVVGLATLIVNAVVGEADFSSVAGPVGIVGMVDDAASFGFTSLLTFTAIISLNLAVINLLPFPALDGGRLVFVAIEAVTRRRIPPVWANRVNVIGFGILMLLMIAVTYNDIVRLL